MHCETARPRNVPTGESRSVLRAEQRTDPEMKPEHLGAENYSSGHPSPCCTATST
jgi:hypothetical protein